MTSLNDPKLYELIKSLVELIEQHEELEDERHSLSYKLGDLDYDDEDERDLLYEYENQQTDLEDEMNKIEEEMKRLIREY